MALEVLLFALAWNKSDFVECMEAAHSVHVANKNMDVSNVEAKQSDDAVPMIAYSNIAYHVVEKGARNVIMALSTAKIAIH